ncbi:MAG: type 4a pilus biogenesis protein PilO [Porticoccaceae bacterium]|jgi:type IV pilus assembly protein PilO|nr:MAG: pilus assembly protein PilP [SAR92 bacterium BACL16 MAG-120619-bin48]KRP26343.1 MAG: pilus assembly protein PilP [SAR92 bacterium BACL16 MAG-120322-bin99]MDP4654967.1 type 4a pilus biogenesis protein PilO [Alphaproteobacteria bacterium]MDP4745448.1 type 4a pilus biogenesis protein PilO [Porticoccaceae bacterium]MDP4753484.1 type 4a pilus biogenesis protein PilO [Porticoccaceae bacterium]
MAFIESLKELKDVDFADLDIQQIGVWPAALKAILLLTVLLVILALGYFFKVQDVSQQTQIAARQEAELLREYENKAFLAANLDAYRAQMVELDETFGALLQQLPKDTEVPGLLEDITEVAYGSGLSMKSISLQPEKTTEYYVELPIRIDVIGDYHDFGSFVSGVASLPRIVTLHDYTIKETEGALLNMVIEAKTYRYKTEVE